MGRRYRNMSKIKEIITYHVMQGPKLIIETQSKDIAEQIQAQYEGSVIVKSRVFVENDSKSDAA